MSMARLWRDNGKRDAARDLLAPVYNRFAEGLDTLDLKRRRRCWMIWRRENAPDILRHQQRLLGAIPYVRS